MFEDSRLIIQALNTSNMPSQMRLSEIIRKIHIIIPSFHKIQFFHILRGLNGEFDFLANDVIRLCKMFLVTNGLHSNLVIP